MSVVTTLLVIGLVLGGILGACSYLIYIERKLAAFMQDRIGPNRVGPWGLLQPIADGLKFLLKEDVIPDKVDKVLYILAPAIAVMTTLMALAVVPVGPTSPNKDDFQVVMASGVDAAILSIFVIVSFAFYGVILGGWASNNKYGLIGALRSSAQVVSYEIPLGMSVLGVILFSGTLNLENIIHHQATVGVWNIFIQPIGALVFLTAAMAEANRLPFDLSECEQELVGGYHTEYSAMKFAMFFLGEYTHVVTVSFLFAILFLGGWHCPGLAGIESTGVFSFAVKWAILLSKVLAVIVFIMLIRWTIPRFRFDQLMGFAWLVLMPLTLINVILVMFVKQFHWPAWLLLPVSLGVLVGGAFVHVARVQQRIARA